MDSPMENERHMEQGQQILRWIQRRGMIFYPGRPERELAKRYLHAMPQVFPDLLSRLSAVYLYRQADQHAEEFQQCDGLLSVDVTTNAGTLYAVGLSVEAVQAGPEYLTYLFIHELAHLQVPCDPGVHSGEFYEQFCALLERYYLFVGRFHQCLHGPTAAQSGP